MLFKKKDLSDRYHLIDALRAAAILNMIAYHLCYDIFCIWGRQPLWFTNPAAGIWERFICCSFILLSGVSLNFSRRAYLRGIIVNLCGLLITAISYFIMPSQMILFGVLNLIGTAMILTRLLQPLFDRIDPLIGTAAAFILFGLSYGVPFGYIGVFNLRLLTLPDAMYRVGFLAPLGLPSPDFFSADYFPLIPWSFLFICGYFLWRALKAHRADRVFRVKIPVLSFLGRHSLLIYLIHQPILLALCYLIFGQP